MAAAGGGWDDECEDWEQEIAPPKPVRRTGPPETEAESSTRARAEAWLGGRGNSAGGWRKTLAASEPKVNAATPKAANMPKPRVPDVGRELGRGTFETDGEAAFGGGFGRDRDGGFGRDRDGGFGRDSGFGRDRDSGFGRDRDSGFGRDRDRDAGFGRDRDRDGGFGRDSGFGRDRDRDNGFGRDRDRDNGFGRDRDSGFGRDRDSGFGRDRDGGFGRDNYGGAFGGRRDGRGRDFSFNEPEIEWEAVRGKPAAAAPAMYYTPKAFRTERIAEDVTTKRDDTGGIAVSGAPSGGVTAGGPRAETAPTEIAPTRDAISKSTIQENIPSLPIKPTESLNIDDIRAANAKRSVRTGRTHTESHGKHDREPKTDTGEEPEGRTRRRAPRRKAESRASTAHTDKPVEGVAR